ncbi:MAG: hypothetical protein PHO70_05525 [Candidatus Omnitrophica bacterium]|nr:hypothetical protein [Candidatus Omnitrophota bacterium]
MVYLFVGHDNLSKDIQLKRLKQESLAKEIEQFNLDILYARELTLKGLQEKILCLPTKGAKRLIVIKDAGKLKDEIKDFILIYAKKQDDNIIFVLDVEKFDSKDIFLNQLSRFAKVKRFQEELKVDTFTLSRSIELKKPDAAIRVLSQLLKDGQRPEWILGGLRYAWEKSSLKPQETQRRLSLLVECDKDIKKGRLKPAFALEKLVISLCCFADSLH